MDWERGIDLQIEHFHGGPTALQNFICYADVWTHWHDMAVREAVQRSCLRHKRNFHEYSEVSNGNAKVVQAFFHARNVDDVLFIPNVRLNQAVADCVSRLSDEIYKGDIRRILNSSAYKSLVAYLKPLLASCGYTPNRIQSTLKNNKTLFFGGLIIGCCSAKRLDKLNERSNTLLGRINRMNVESRGFSLVSPNVEGLLAIIEKQVSSNPTLTSEFDRFRVAYKLSATHAI